MPTLTAPISSPPTLPKVWTYDDYLSLPDDDKRYEIIEGELYVSNAPNYLHQLVASKMARLLGNFVSDQAVGVVLVAPFEVHLSVTSRPVQPDILFIATEKLPQEDAQFYTGVPDLIVEVLSPSSLRLDRSIKFAAYEKAGVAEYWIVNPRHRNVEIYTLKDGEYTLHGDFSDDERITSLVLVGLELPVSQIFG